MRWANFMNGKMRTGTTGRISIFPEAARNSCPTPEPRRPPVGERGGRSFVQHAARSAVVEERPGVALCAENTWRSCRPATKGDAVQKYRLQSSWRICSTHAAVLLAIVVQAVRIRLPR
jgi:hypothetical protein